MSGFRSFVCFSITDRLVAMINSMKGEILDPLLPARKTHSISYNFFFSQSYIILEFRSSICCSHRLKYSTSDLKSLPWFLKRYELSANWSQIRIPNPYNEPMIIFIVFVLLNWFASKSSCEFYQMKVYERNLREDPM